MAEFKVLELSPLRRTIPPPSRRQLLNQHRPRISNFFTATEATLSTDLTCSTLTALEEVLQLLRHPPLLPVRLHRPLLLCPLLLLLVRHCRHLLQDQQSTSILSIALVVVTIVVVIRTFLLAYWAAAVEMGWSSAFVRRSPSWTSGLRRRRTLPNISSTIAY